MPRVIRITTVEDFLKIDTYVQHNHGAQDYTFKLMNNLDLNGIEFFPFGYDKVCFDYYNFRGEFDGQNYTISNLNITLSTNYTALIGVNYGIIKNLNLDNTCKIIGYNDVGSICGENCGIIENCKSAAIIEGNNCIGGICGKTNDFIKKIEIKNSNFFGVINGNEDVGGICGNMQNGNYENLISRGIIKGNKNIGGICGRMAICPSNKIFLNKMKNYSTLYGIENINQIVGLNDNSDSIIFDFIEDGIINKIKEMN